MRLDLERREGQSKEAGIQSSTSQVASRGGASDGVEVLQSPLKSAVDLVVLLFGQGEGLCREPTHDILQPISFIASS